MESGNDVSLCISSREIGFGEIRLTVIPFSMQNQDEGMIFDFPIN